jgi:hypothetical protein
MHLKAFIIINTLVVVIANMVAMQMTKMNEGYRVQKNGNQIFLPKSSTKHPESATTSTTSSPSSLPLAIQIINIKNKCILPYGSIIPHIF